MLTEGPPTQPREPQWDKPALSGRAIGGCLLLVAVVVASGLGFWAMRSGQLRFDVLDRLTGTAPTPTPAVEVPTTVDATTAIEAPTPTPESSPIDADHLQKDIEAQYQQKVREMAARLEQSRAEFSSGTVEPLDIHRVGGEVEPPRVVRRVQPKYTEEARQERLQGVTILEAVIDEHGEVAEIRVLKGLGSGLDTAAVDAVKQWKFVPAMLHGKPVAVYFTLTVSFKLDSRSAAD